MYKINWPEFNEKKNMHLEEYILSKAIEASKAQMDALHRTFDKYPKRKFNNKQMEKYIIKEQASLDAYFDIVIKMGLVDKYHQLSDYYFKGREGEIL